MLTNNKVILFHLIGKTSRDIVFYIYRSCSKLANNLAHFSENVDYLYILNNNIKEFILKITTYIVSRLARCESLLYIVQITFCYVYCTLTFNVSWCAFTSYLKNHLAFIC